MRKTGYCYLEVEGNAKFIGHGTVNMSTGTTLPKSYILFINIHTKNGMDTNLKINNPEFHPFSTILSTINFVLMVKKLRHMNVPESICQTQNMLNVYSILFCTLRVNINKVNDK
jgi:hypothetical protein